MFFSGRTFSRSAAALVLGALSLAQAQVSPTEAALDAVPAVRAVRPGEAVPGTPADLNASITVRYGSATPNAVLLLMPGFLGGAGSFDRLARQIVSLDAGVAVWAVDRRSNLLESGAAIANADPAELVRIVQQGIPARPASSLTFMKNWGLDTTLRDWREAVREAHTLTPNVFIGGHSLGGTLTGLYAGYDFGNAPYGAAPTPDDQIGFKGVRGLLMLDGAPGNTTSDPISWDQYQNGSVGRLGYVPGVNRLDEIPYVNSLIFNPTYASRAVAQARLATTAPDALAPAGGLVPYAATNLAAGLSQLERQYSLLPFLTLRTGEATNAAAIPNPLPRLLGAAENSQFVLGPADPSHPVGWVADADAATDPLDFVGRFWNPLSDYAEWYFPMRLSVDVGAAQLDTVGTPYATTLRVWHTRAVSTPILGISAQNGITTENDYRHFAAFTRAAVTTHTLPGASHLDITVAKSDQVARWTLDWLRGITGPSQSSPTDSALLRQN
ncbi:alpha/beta hydrolase [Deinococcus oregonensis]|uniref:Alpha/beta hydrolase n=1 Tax=Deinococcus oregonensis TaxID=1805970 RepID=A0ABV6AZY3_9DEIO